MRRQVVGSLLVVVLLVCCVSCSSNSNSSAPSVPAANSGQPKKTQSEQFARLVLPTQLFDDPKPLLDPLISENKADADEVLRQLWDAAGTFSGNRDGAAPERLDHTMEVFGDPTSTAALLTLPTPTKSTESHFAAIVFDGPGMADGTAKQLRYFTLEEGESDQGKLVEWTSDEHAILHSEDHADGVAEDLAAFSQKVQEVMGVGAGK